MEVYFGNNFWNHRHKGRAGRKVELHQSFEWDGYPWLIPAAYLCSKGLVLDFCKQIPKQRIQSLMDRWEEKAKQKQISQEEHELLEFENPMGDLIHFKASMNGRIAEGISMCSVCWNPLLQKEAQEAKEVNELVEEYQCDQEQGWQFTRAAIPWPYKRRPEKVSLTLNIKPYTLPYPCGQHFTVSMEDSSRQILVTHPVSNNQYTLYISGMQSEELPEKTFQRLGSYEFPKHFVRLGYHFDQESAYSEFTINDCVQSDRPRPIPVQEGEAVSYDCAASVGIIGGVSAAFTLEQEQESQLREQYAISSLHFEPVQQVEWRISALIKRGEEIALELPMIIREES